MKYLGIDFGSKRVGVAISDDLGSLAFPKEVLTNDHKLIAKILEIIKKEKVTLIVLGESKNFAGEPNDIMEKIEKFKLEIEKASMLKVFYELEFLSSVQAKQVQGQNDLNDASAAAIILQSFLDKQK